MTHTWYTHICRQNIYTHKISESRIRKRNGLCVDLFNGKWEKTDRHWAPKFHWRWYLRIYIHIQISIYLYLYILYIYIFILKILKEELRKMRYVRDNQETKKHGCYIQGCNTLGKIIKILLASLHMRNGCSIIPAISADQQSRKTVNKLWELCPAMLQTTTKATLVASARAVVWLLMVRAFQHDVLQSQNRFRYSPQAHSQTCSAGIILCVIYNIILLYI